MIGATIAAAPSIKPSIPKKAGRFRSGMICEMIVKAPAPHPADPSPATARPATNIVDVTAVADSIDPSKKKATEIMRMILIGNR